MSCLVLACARLASAVTTQESCYDPIKPGMTAAGARKGQTCIDSVIRKAVCKVRKHGGRKCGCLLYRDGHTRRYATLGVHSEMSKAQAEARRDELVAEANARNAKAPNPDITFGDFIEGVALPFLRSKWKRSTAATTENRIQHHVKGEFGRDGSPC